MNKRAILSWLTLGAIFITMILGTRIAAAAAVIKSGTPENGRSAPMGAAANPAASVRNAPASAAASGEVRRVGTVTGYSPGTSITIQDRKGASYTFQLVPSLKIVPWHRASQLGVGAYVTVISPANEPYNKLTAVGIVIHRGAPGGGHTGTLTATATNTPTHTPTNTPTNTSTNTPTITPSFTATNTPTLTPTYTATHTPTLTSTYTATHTPTTTATSTATGMVTHTATATNTPTATSAAPVIRPLLPGEKPDIDNPQEWSPDPLTTIIGYTFPKEINDQLGWTIPLEAAAFEPVQPPASGVYAKVGMVKIGLNFTNVVLDQGAPESSCGSAPGAKGRGNGANPRELERHGIVVVYDPGNRIIIVDRDGTPYQFALPPTLKVVPPHRADSLSPGSFVTIIAPANDPNNKQTATGLVVHKGLPGCFPIPASITFEVLIDVVSTTEEVPGVLVAPGPSNVTIDVTFGRIPQIENPERDPDLDLPYDEFETLGDAPRSGVSIASDGVCFVVNDEAVVGPESPIRYCSTAAATAFAPTLAIDRSLRQALPFLLFDPSPDTSLLSVSDTFEEQYAFLQQGMSAAADRFGSLGIGADDIQLDQIISTIEDHSRLQACASAQTEQEKEQVCNSDFTLAPLLPDFYEASGEPFAGGVKRHVAVAKVVQPIGTPTGVIPVGDYLMDYYFDGNGVFVAAFFTGYSEGSSVIDVVNLQAPAVPATFLNADGSDLPGAHISACRVIGRCVFQRSCP